MELVGFLFVTTRTMRISIKSLLVFFLSLGFLFSQVVYAEDNEVVTVQSPGNRVALLELYTSQGCSSCPPAEQWLSSLKQSGVSSQQIIPLAFHVTYWDYIGWRDRFGSERYDQRQRQISRYNGQRTIYTPQFVLGGSDYRTYNRFTDDVQNIISQNSAVDLKVTARQISKENIDVDLQAITSNDDKEKLALYLAVYEDDLSSHVEDGENEGETLHHDYVVRQFHGPFVQSMINAKTSINQSIDIETSWKKEDLYLVAFAQSMQSGEILQAVRLKLK
jgi:hypothetical protein